MIFRRCRLGVRLVLRHAVEDHDAVAQMDMVAGHADQPLHQGQILGISIRIQVRHGLDEDHNVVAPGLAVVNQRHPLRGRGQGDAIHQQVVAHQQRLLHRAGGNDVVLRQKGEDEQAHHQNRAECWPPPRKASLPLLCSSGWARKASWAGVFFFVILSLFVWSVDGRFGRAVLCSRHCH